MISDRVLLILISGHCEYFTSEESVIIIDYSSFIVFKYVIDNKAYRFVLLSCAIELIILVSVLALVSLCSGLINKPDLVPSLLRFIGWGCLKTGGKNWLNRQLLSHALSNFADICYDDADIT